MPERRLYCDKAEVVALINSKGGLKDIVLSKGDIIRIQFDRCKEFKLFLMRPSEKITIVNRKTGEKPIIFTRFKSKPFFDIYKQELAQFAKENRVTFFDNTTQA